MISNASEIARHLAQQLDPLSASSFARTPRYLVLDCRFTVEKQLLDAHYIEGSVGVPQVVQEEICALARHKSALLEHGEMEMELSDLADPADIERSFAGAVAQLSMRTAAVLALLWAAFVNDTTEEVHFAIADDSAGPYECPSEQNRSPLNTSYALPYQTASGASDGIPLRQRAFSDATENLPQYLTHSTATLSNVSAINFASALIILGFPRVSIVQGEVIFKESRSNENLMFSCTENNSFSSLPVMKTEQRSSGFTCLVHHLGACGVNTSTINARYSYIQVPVDHFKEYQVTAFAHQLRTSVMSPDHIDLDFYSCTAADNELLKGATPGRTTSSSSKSGGKDSTGGKSAPSSAQKAPPVSLVAGVISATSTVRSSSSFSASSSNSINNNNNKNMSKTTLSSSISSALSAFTPGVSPRSTTQHQTPTTTRDNNRNRGSSLDAPLSASLLTTAGLLSALGGFDGSPTSSTMMQAKLSCNLDNLFQLLLIMSAQKKRHIIRLVIGSNFHSTVPLARVYSHSPLSEEEFGYARLLGPKPEGGDHLCDSKFSPTSRVHNAHNLLYYEKLERLLTLRDTLQELVNTQRLNDVLDKTSNRMITKMRLLRSAIEQTNKHTRRSVAGLQRKTILRSTQQRLQAQAEAHASSAITTIKKTNGAEIGVGGGHEEGATAAVSAVEWHVSQDLSAFFRAESGSQPPSEQGGSRSSSVLRDSISVDGGGDRGSRLMSDDSIDIQTNISKSLSDLL